MKPFRLYQSARNNYRLQYSLHTFSAQSLSFTEVSDFMKILLQQITYNMDDSEILKPSNQNLKVTFLV